MVPKITNLASFKRVIESQKRKVKATVTERYQAFTKNVLMDLAINTPQWSGDLAASWQVVVGKGSAPDSRTTILKTTPYERPAPFFKGDMPAVRYAVMMNEDAIKSIRWNSVVSLQNTSPTVAAIEGKQLTFEPSAKKDQWLRPNNYIPGDIMAVNHVAHKWSTKRGYSELNVGMASPI